MPSSAFCCFLNPRPHYGILVPRPSLSLLLSCLLPRPAFDLSASLSRSCSCVRARTAHDVLLSIRAFFTFLSISSCVFRTNPRPSCHRAWLVDHESLGRSLRCRARVLGGPLEAILKPSGGGIMKPLGASWGPLGGFWEHRGAESSNCWFGLGCNVEAFGRRFEASSGRRGGHVEASGKRF